MEKIHQIFVIRILISFFISESRNEAWRGIYQQAKQKQKIDCGESCDIFKTHIYGLFWFKKGYIDGLNVVRYVFGPSWDYSICNTSQNLLVFEKIAEFYISPYYRIGLNWAPGFNSQVKVFGWGSIQIYAAWGSIQEHEVYWFLADKLIISFVSD